MKSLKYKIIYEDDKILIVDKPSGLLTIASNDKNEPNLFHMVSLHVKEKDKYAKVFIVNRLDKLTSGLVVFAKDYDLKIKLQSYFEDRTVIRKYEAIVAGILKKDKDRIKIKLVEDKFGNVFISNHGKEAITDYVVVKNDGTNTLVDISLVTGRKNQIRLAFVAIKHPIIGDTKYAKEYAKNTKRMMLNCYELVFPNDAPISQHNFSIQKKFQL